MFDKYFQLNPYAKLFRLTILVEVKGPHSPSADQSLSPTRLNYPTIFSPPVKMLVFRSPPRLPTSLQWKGVPVHFSSAVSEALKASPSQMIALQILRPYSKGFLSCSKAGVRWRVKAIAFPIIWSNKINLSDLSTGQDRLKLPLSNSKPQFFLNSNHLIKLVRSRWC